jgi:hypothetical protein
VPLPGHVGAAQFDAEVEEVVAGELDQRGLDQHLVLAPVER